jgi:enterobactin synthetase component D
VSLFQPSRHHATPHGVLSAVVIPDRPDPVPDGALAALDEAERSHAAGLRGYRQVAFVGGRIALAAARRQLGAPAGPALPDGRGAPTLPEGWVGSISHKRDLAIAMVARAAGGTLGVDLEDYGPPRLSIADRVLRPGELEAVSHLPEDRRWIATVVRFSIKEAIYKALDPWVHRYVDFLEAEVTPNLAGNARVSLHLQHNEGPFDVDARYEWWNGRILSSVRIRRAESPPG